MDCLFCRIIEEREKSYTLYENDYAKVILDAFPQTDGHLLIIPKKHFEDIMEIDDKTLLEVNKLAKKFTKILMQKLNKKSITHLINYGDEQIIKHFHYHLIPDFKLNAHNYNNEEIFNILNK